MSEKNPEKKAPKGCGCLGWACALGIFVFVVGIALGPLNEGGIKHWPASASVQAAHSINLAMFYYANDNEGRYPNGSSSTEVFQKLLDGQYVSDPETFYLAMPGKIQPVAGQRLKPDNVSFDVTGGIDTNSSDQLPVVFMTGYTC